MLIMCGTGDDVEMPHTKLHTFPFRVEANVTGRQLFVLIELGRDRTTL